MTTSSKEAEVPTLESVSAYNGRNYWLAIAGDTNCGLLSNMGRPFFALSHGGRALAHMIEVGDLCAFYRARSAQGFIGLYEVSERVSEKPTRVGAKTYTTRVPWKPICISESQPAQLAPLVPHLTFIKNKSNCGAYFQTSLRRLSSEDYAVIEEAVWRQKSTEQGGVA